MTTSSQMAMRIPDERIPPIPGTLGDNECRALIALHMEKTLFNSEDAFGEILSDFNIQDTERILDILKKRDAFIKTIITKLQDSTPKENEEVYVYNARRAIYWDAEEEQWNVDLEILQEKEAKYDKLDLLLGKCLICFNPHNARPKISVYVGDINIRSNNELLVNKLLQGNVSAMAGSQCTCGNTPCTCGSMSSNEDVEDYSIWDAVLQKASDRDIVIYFEDGEEVLRV
jgi:hypothetical protein